MNNETKHKNSSRITDYALRKLKTHKDLDVWNKAMDLAKKNYSLTTDFPQKEQYSIVPQIRRSVISIPSNIAEGAARNSNKEFIQYLYIALGSTAEMETQMLLSKRLGFLRDSNIFLEIEDIRKMLLGLIRFLKRKT